MTVKEWRDTNPEKKGNIRVYAIIEKLVVLSNMESINALLNISKVLRLTSFFIFFVMLI
ncbi:hypothetical protein D3C87_600880 [compost metagenome]